MQLDVIETFEFKDRRVLDVTDKYIYLLVSRCNGQSIVRVHDKSGTFVQDLVYDFEIGSAYVSPDDAHACYVTQTLGSCAGPIASPTPLTTVKRPVFVRGLAWFPNSHEFCYFEEGDRDSAVDRDDLYDLVKSDNRLFSSIPTDIPHLAAMPCKFVGVGVTVRREMVTAYHGDSRVLVWNESGSLRVLATKLPVHQMVVTSHFVVATHRPEFSVWTQMDWKEVPQRSFDEQPPVLVDRDVVLPELQGVSAKKLYAATKSYLEALRRSLKSIVDQLPTTKDRRRQFELVLMSSQEGLEETRQRVVDKIYGEAMRTRSELNSVTPDEEVAYRSMVFRAVQRNMIDNANQSIFAVNESMMRRGMSFDGAFDAMLKAYDVYCSSCVSVGPYEHFLPMEAPDDHVDPVTVSQRLVVGNRFVSTCKPDVCTMWSVNGEGKVNPRQRFRLQQVVDFWSGNLLISAAAAVAYRIIEGDAYQLRRIRGRYFRSKLGKIS